MVFLFTDLQIKDETSLFPADEKAEILERVQVGNIVPDILIIILRITITIIIIKTMIRLQPGRKGETLLSPPSETSETS